MMIALTADDIQRATDLRGAVRAVDEAYQHEAAGTPAISERINLRFASGWIRLMAAALPDLGIVGYKEFHLVGGTVRYQVNLFDLHSGEPLACLDGDYLTALRTAATAGLAATRLAGDASSVGVLGSGAEARTQAMVMGEVLSVDRMSVYSRSQDNRERFAADLSTRLGIEVKACPDAATAVATADLIIVATNTAGAGPALLPEWLPPRAHISSIGSTLPEQRELHHDVWRFPELVVVDTTQVLAESGDAIAAARAGTLDKSRVITLSELCSRPPGTATPGRTLYKSVGSPLQDVAVAAYAHRSAQELGLGTELPEFLSVKAI